MPAAARDPGQSTRFVRTRTTRSQDWPGHVMRQVGRRWRMRCRIERVGQLMCGSRSGGGGGSSRVRWLRQAVRTRSRAGRQAVHGGSTGGQTCQTNAKPHTITDFLLRCDLLGASRVNYAPRPARRACVRVTVRPSMYLGTFCQLYKQLPHSQLHSQSQTTYCQSN